MNKADHVIEDKAECEGLLYVKTTMKHYTEILPISREFTLNECKAIARSHAEHLNNVDSDVCKVELIDGTKTIWESNYPAKEDDMKRWFLMPDDGYMEE